MFTDKLSVKRLFFTLTPVIFGILFLNCGRSSERMNPLEKAVHNYVWPYVNTNNFSGVLLAAKEGKIVINRGYGLADYEHNVPNTPETKFYTASVSKTFTAAAIMLLQERGLLAVSNTVSRFIPDYPQGDRITIEHLLSHTSGIPRYIFLPDYNKWSKHYHTAEQVVEIFRDLPLDFNPGEGSGYSNSNYALLAYIIELVSGLSYGEYLRINIFEPLRMFNTGFFGKGEKIVLNRASGYEALEMLEFENASFFDRSNGIGAGSIYSTAEDLLKWIRELYRNTILQLDSAGKILGDYTDKIFDRNALQISGWDNYGFTSFVLHFPDEDLSVIVLSNLDIISVKDEIARNVSAIVLG
jgi:CubicO group peptidase (beta-lactamase class C family)